jgi:hypothetical protein
MHIENISKKVDYFKKSCIFVKPKPNRHERTKNLRRERQSWEVRNENQRMPDRPTKGTH